jgi:hypothetical protein
MEWSSGQLYGVYLSSCGCSIIVPLNIDPGQDVDGECARGSPYLPTYLCTYLGTLSSSKAGIYICIPR